MSPHHDRRRATLALLCATTALLLATACADSDGGAAPATPSPAGTSPASPPPTRTTGTVHITMKDFAFSPATLEVRPGEEITVSNEDSTAHTMTATEGNAFDTGTIDGDKSGSFKAPTQPGTYSFVCTFHPDMKGTLTVR